MAASKRRDPKSTSVSTQTNVLPPTLEMMETRTMMSGDVMRASIVFVADDVAGADGLVRGGLGVEVVHLNAQENAFDQISRALAGRSGLESIQFLTHGSSGRMSLAGAGNQGLTARTLDANAGTVSSWGKALAVDGDILLWGCDVGAGAAGRAFVNRLAAMTGADVGASSNLTGSGKLGGDWNLEVKVGKLETTDLLNVLGNMSDYAFVLAAPTIAGAVAGQAVNETGLIRPFDGVVIASDAPSATLAVSVTLDMAAKGVFTAGSLAASGFAAAGGGVYTFTGTATQATAAIALLNFDPTNNRGNTGSAETTTFTISADNGVDAATTNSGTTVISTAVNEPSAISGTAANQAVNDNATVNPFAGVTIGDPDTVAQTLTVTVSLDAAGKGVFGSASLTASGFVDAGGGVYTFSGTAAASTAAIAQLVFVPTANRVAVGLTETSTLTISVTDGATPATTSSGTTVISTSMNTAPTIGGATAGQAVTDKTTVAPFTGLTITDPDPTQRLTVTVTLDAAAKGVFSAASLAASGFANAGGGVYTFTGTGAQATTAIRQLVFVPTPDRVAVAATETTQFAVTVSDGIAAAASNSVTTVVSTSVNDAPAISGTMAAQAVNDKATVLLFSGVTIADVDPSTIVTVSVTIDTAAKGVFTSASLTASGFADAAGGVYTFTGTPAAATAAIRALVFDPTENRVAVGSTETSIFTISVNDTVAAAVTNSATTAVSTSINDLPTFTGTSAGQAVSDNATVNPFAGVTIGDVDPSTTLTISITLDNAAKGVFTAGSLTASGFADAGGGMYTFTGTPAAATTAIRALVFNPTNDRVAVGATETSTFALSADDGHGVAATNSATAVVSTSINDAPTIGGTAAGQAINDNATLTPFSGVTIGDLDPSTTLSISVTIDNAAKGVFTTASLTASGFVNATGGVYTFTGTPAQATAAIRAIVFNPTDNRTAQGTSETSTFTVSANDGIAAAATDSVTTVVSTSVNDAPTINGVAPNQGVNDTGTLQPFSGVTIADADPSTTLSISVTIDTAAKGVFTSASLIASGFVDAGGGVYTFSGSPAAATTAIRALTFNPTDNRVASTTAETSTFTISVDDGVAPAVTNSTTTVVSTSVNDAPTIGGVAAAQAVNDTGTLNPFGGVTIADVDPSTTLSISVSIDAAAKGVFTGASLAASGFVAGGGGVYTFSGSPAAAQAAIRALVFNPSDNRVNPTLTETSTFTISAQDGVAGAVTDNTTTVVSTSMNDAPVITGTVAGQVVNDIATDMSFAGVTISDADVNQSLAISVTIDTPGKGVFTAGSLTATGFASAGAGVYTFTGTAAQATAAIRGLVFNPSDNQVASGTTQTSTFTVAVDDSIASPVSDAATSVISTNVNDAPVITGTAAGQGVNDNATVALFTGVTINDVDPFTTLGVSVTIDSAAKGVFTSASLTASGFVDAGLGVYTFSGTPAAATTAIRQLVFAPTANRVAVGGTETSTFTVFASDGADEPPDDMSTTVVSTSMNDAPTIGGAVAGQTVNDTATRAPFTGVTIGDVDPSTTLSVSVTIDTAAKGVFTAASLTASGFVGATGGVYTFTGTPAAVQAAIRALVFDPTDNRVNQAATETSTFTISVDDGIAAATTNSTTTVISTSMNDAPVIGGTVGGQTVGDTATVSPFNNATFFDADPGTTLSVSVTLNNSVKGVFTPASLTASGFVDAGGGVYTFSGTPANAQAAIRALIFDPTDNRVASQATETTVFTISINDGVAPAVTDNASTVISTNVNDAPIIGGVVAGQTVSDSATVSPFTGVTIGDVDPGTTLSVSVTVDAAAKGTFTSASLTASGFVSAGGGVYTFSGSPAAAQAAIRALVFDPADNRVASGTTETSTFTISINDGVAATSTNGTTTVVSTNVNDAPTISGTVTGQTVYDTATVSPFTGVTIGDVDPGTTLAVSVTIDAAAKGVFTLTSLTSSGFADAGGGVYTFTGSAAAATTAIRALVFSPADNRVASGATETSTFTISADDAVAAATTDAAATVISTNANDAPTITGAAGGQTVNDNATMSPFAGVTIGDADPGTSLAISVTIDAAAKGVFTPASLTTSGFVAAGGGVYTFTGSATAATTAIRALVFNPTDNRVASGATETSTFTISVNDAVATAAIDSTTTVISTNTNDAPVIGGTVAAQAVNDNATVSPFTGVTFADADPNQTQTVTVALDNAAKGVFTPASLAATGFISSGGGVYTLAGTAAQAQAAIRGLVFDPTNDRGTVGSTETTTFTISVDDGVASATTDSVTTAISTSINNAPTITGVAAAQTANDTATVQPFASVTIGDADPGTTLSISVTLDNAAKGVFTAGSLTSSGFADAGGGVYTFTGTAADATVAIRALIFNPTDNRVATQTTETTTFTVSADDGVAAATVSSVTTVVSTNVNDAPMVGGASGGQAVNDNASISPFTGVTFADVDPGTTLTVSVALDAAGKGVFTSASLAASGFASAGGGLYTFTGTPAAAQAAVRALVFAPTANRVNPTLTETTTFTISISDGIAPAVTSNGTTVISTSLNDAPTITGVVGSQAVNDNATRLPFTAVTLADADNAQTLSVSVSIDDSAKGVFTSASLTASGFVSAGGGAYTFSGTSAQATAAIRSLAFAPTNNRIAPGTVEISTFTISVNDGIATAATNSVTTVVTISINNVPTVTGAAAAQAVNDNATVSPFTGLTIADVDNPAQVQTITVTLSAAANGVFTAASLTASGFVSGGGGVYTLEATATDATTAIRLLVFQPATNHVNPGTTETTTFTVAVSDGFVTVTNTGSSVVSTPVNDPTTITGTASSQAVNDNATVTPFGGVTIGDADTNQSLTVTVTLSAAANGAFSTASLASSGFASSGGGVYTFTGTAAAATTAIRALVFVPTANRLVSAATETTTFAVSASDGLVAATTDSTTTVVTTSVNDAPTIIGTVAGQIVNDNATRSPFGGVTLGDVDAGTTLTVSVTIDDVAKGVFTAASLTASGFVASGGGAYTFTGTPAAATAAIRALVFDPTDNRSAAGMSETSTFTVSVSDSIATAVTNSTTTVVSLGVNDAPTVTGVVGGQAVNDTATVSPFTGVTLGDVDPGTTLSVSVTLDSAAKGVFTSASLAASGFAAAGGGIYTFTGTAAAATNAIRALVFAPTANRVAAGGTETTTFTISASDGIAAATTSSAATVVSTSVNDAPTIGGTASAQAVNDTAVLSPFAGVTFGDVDPGTTLSVSVTIDDASRGVFTASSLTASGFVSAGGGVYTFTGTAAAATTAIRALVFNPADNRVASGATETSTFTVSASDGVALAVTNSVTTVVSTNLNDVPTITGAVGGQVVNDNATRSPFSGVTFGDVDPGTTLSVSVTIDSAAKGVFSAGSLTSSGFASVGGGVYTFTGTAAAATTAIRALVFTPTANRVNPGSTETSAFTISVSDGVASPVTNSVTTLISTSMNDAPTISGAVGAQAVHDTATRQPFTGVTVGDVDLAQTLSVSVAIDSAAKGVFTAASLTASGFVSAGGGVYTFTGTGAAATTAIRALVFAPASNRVAVGSTETTTFTIGINDGASGTASNVTTTVVSTSINDAPTIGGAVAGQAVNDNATVRPFTAVVFGDIDVASSLTVTVTLDNSAKGVFTPASLTTSGFVVVGAGVYSFTGTPAAAQAAARALVFAPTNNRVGPSQTETTAFTVSVNDGFATPVTNTTTTVVSTGVNDAPIISGAAAGQTMVETATRSLFSQVSITESDTSSSLTVSVTLDTAGKGTFTTASLTGTGFVAAGGGVYTFTGTAAAATTAIRGLMFAPASNRVGIGFTETTTFTIAATDGFATPATDSATTVAVLSVNDVPVVGTLAASPGTVARRGTMTLTASGVSDSDGAVTRVEFYRDANGNGTLEVGTDTMLGTNSTATAGAYSLAVNTAGFAAGTNTFFARAIDNLALVGGAATGTGTVSNLVPTITAVTRSVDPVVNLGDNITLTATGAADVDGTVSGVEFYRDADGNGLFDTSIDTLIGQDTSAVGGYTLTISTAGFVTGTNRYFARAVDNDGTGSTAVTVAGRINSTPTFTTFGASVETVVRKTAFTLSASGAADTDGTVARVEFYRDSNGNGTFEAGVDALLGSDAAATAGVYSLSVATAAFSAGTNTFFARTVDNNASFSTSRTTTVTVANIAPTITAVTRSIDPVVNLGDNITLTATGAVDADGTVGRVEFYRDADGNGVFNAGTDTYLGQDNSAVGGYTLLMSTETFSVGTNRYFARTVDSDGATSAAVTVTGRINAAPTYSTFTTSVTTINRRSTFTLSASGGADTDGTISKVEFFRDSNGNGIFDDGSDTLLGSDLTAVSGGYSFVVNTTGFTAGTNTFFARVVDNNTASSATRAATVTVNNLAPTITSTTASTPRVLQLGNSVTLTAVGVADLDSTIAAVRFYRDADGDNVLDTSIDTLLGSDTVATGGYTLVTATSGFAVGTNRVFTQVTDSDGGTSTVANTTVVVNAAPTMGGVAVNPSPISRTANYTLTATTPIDSDGTIARVEFYRDRGVLGTFESTVDLLMGAATFTGGVWRLTLAGSGLAAGSHTFFARAQDNNGSWSNVVTITVIAA